MHYPGAWHALGNVPLHSVDADTVLQASGRSALPDVISGGHAARVAWYLRVVELTDGRWACRHGLQQFDIVYLLAV